MKVEGAVNTYSTRSRGSARATKRCARALSASGTSWKATSIPVGPTGPIGPTGAPPDSDVGGRVTTRRGASPIRGGAAQRTQPVTASVSERCAASYGSA